MKRKPQDTHCWITNSWITFFVDTVFIWPSR